MVGLNSENNESMLEKIEKLLKREEEIKERFSKVSKAADAVQQIYKTDRHFIEYPIMVKLLEKKADQLKEMLMKVREKIEKEQNKCPHKYPDGQDAHIKYQGHDHNWDYYTCVFCNHEEQR